MLFFFFLIVTFIDLSIWLWGFPDSSVGLNNPPAMQEITVRFLGWEDPLEKGESYPLQYFGLENSMDCIVHQITKSRTGLSNFHFHFV